MDFGQALEALKAGKRVSRAGWNGKNLWLILVTPPNTTWIGDAEYPLSPYIAMKAAGGDIQPGWLASQPDMLANDWGVVGE